MSFKIAYTSDLHGNLAQYRALAEYPADAIIIGGDICPSTYDDKADKQRIFICETLPELLKGKKFFLIMGNDDYASNMDVLPNNVHNRRVKLTDDFDIVGYSFVETTFNTSDWEQDNNLIMMDLSSKLFTENPRRTVYVMHCPPQDTNLDLTIDMRHVGNIAIRTFIEKRQPCLTLHGHVHATVHSSGKFMEQIGKTISLAAGNNHNSPDLSVIVFDLYDPEKAERIELKS